MTGNLQHLVHQKLQDAREVWLNPDNFSNEKIARIVETFSLTILEGKKVAFVGNGGSAAEAMHLAAEFIGKCVIDHDPLPVLCLNDSQSAITAIGNDYGFNHIFSRQVKALLNEGDLLIALSTSGKSKNVLLALEAAQKLNVKTMLWMGDFEINLPRVDVYKVPSKSTPRIQEVHLAWGHIVAEVIESSLNL